MGFNGADHAPCHDETKSVNGVRWVWHNHHIAGRTYRLGQIGKAFFGTKRGDDLCVGVEFHAKAAIIITRHRAAQTRYPLRRGIAIGARLTRIFNKFFNNMLGHRQIRIAHAKVNDVGSCGAHACFEFIDLLEHIRR